MLMLGILRKCGAKSKVSNIRLNDKLSTIFKLLESIIIKTI